MKVNLKLLARLALLALLTTWFAPGVDAAPGTPANPTPKLANGIFALQTRVSRTAVWVGDQFEYVVRVEHAPGIEFVRDHLKKEELNLRPFDITAVTSSSGALANGHHYFEVHIGLVTFDVAPDAVIPTFNLFYFRSSGPAVASAPGKDETPAEILAVPVLPVSVRSTVTDAGTGIRDQEDVLPVRMRVWAAPLIAGLLGLAALAGAAGWIVTVQIRSGAWKHRKAERARKKSFSESLQEIRGLPGESTEEIDAFYRKATDVIRNLAAEKLGNGAGLTGPELEKALNSAGSNPRQAATMGELLQQCDLIRYSPDGLETGRRVRVEFLRKFEELAERHS